MESSADVLGKTGSPCRDQGGAADLEWDTNHRVDSKRWNRSHYLLPKAVTRQLFVWVSAVVGHGVYNETLYSIRLKGISARVLLQEFPHLRKPFWADIFELGDIWLSA